MGDLVGLDGGRSTDLDGDRLRHRWSFLSRPAGSRAVLSDPGAELAKEYALTGDCSCPK